MISFFALLAESFLQSYKQGWHMKTSLISFERMYFKLFLSNEGRRTRHVFFFLGGVGVMGFVGGRKLERFLTIMGIQQSKQKCVYWASLRHPPVIPWALACQGCWALKGCCAGNGCSAHCWEEGAECDCGMTWPGQTGLGWQNSAGILSECQFLESTQYGVQIKRYTLC